MAHKASGNVNKIDPMSSAEVQKSSKATSAVITIMTATIEMRLIHHRDCNGRRLM